MSTPPADRTLELLERWHRGERPALEALLEKHLPELSRFVERSLRSELRALRRHHDAADLVNDAAAKVLGYLPRFVPKDGEQFQRLLRTFVRNEIRNRLRSPAARPQGPLEGRVHDSRIDLSAPSSSSVHPDRAAGKAERLALTRAMADLALQFLDDEERRIIELRTWGERDWPEIAREIGSSPDATRMRHKRAMARLSNHIRTIRDGRVDSLLESSGM